MYIVIAVRGKGVTYVRSLPLSFVEQIAHYSVHNFLYGQLTSPGLIVKHDIIVAWKPQKRIT